MNSGAWYRHRWPWFIVGLMAAAIGGTLLMVGVSLRQADGVVIDHYYAAGLGIDRSLGREQRARTLGQRASLALDAVTGQASLQLSGTSQPAQLQLNLLSPTQPERDTHVLLRASGVPGQYIGYLPAPVSGRRFIELLGEAQGQTWRLFEEERLVDGQAATLGDDAIPGERAP